MQRSADGIDWKVHAPLNVTWRGVQPTGIEEGGFERMASPDGSGKYYLIGGGGGPCYARQCMPGTAEMYRLRTTGQWG